MYCGEGVVPADCFDDSTMIMLPAALLVLMLIPACVIRCATRGNESKRRRGADVPIEERQLLSINAVPRLRSLDKAESEEKVTPRFRAQELRFYVLFFILMVNIAELYMRYMLREVKPWATSSWLAPLIAEVGVFVAMYTYEKFQEWKRLRYCYVLLIFWMASFAAHLFRMVAYDVKEKDQVFLNNTHLFIVICYFIMIMIEFYSLMRGPVMVPHDDDDSDGPLVLNEVFASFWSYQTYQWFAPVLKMGIKGQLSMPALGRLPIEDRAENRFKTWDRIFTAHKVKKGGNPVLWRVIWAAYKWDLIISAICQGAGTGLQYAGPLVLKGITTYVLAVHAAAAGSGASDASADVNIIIGSDGQPTTGSSVLTATDFFANGYVLAFLLLVANTAQAILLNQTQYITTRAGVNLRAAMQVSIYKKSLRIANLKTGATSFGKIVNHMSTDVMKLMNLFNNLMSLWCSPVEMCVTMGILISIVGAPAAFAGFGVTALALPVQIFCGRRMRRAQAGVLRQVDQRLKKTNELVTGMKIIKLYAWESPFVSAIKAIREKELKLYWKLGIYKAGLILLTQGLPVIVPLVAFAVAAGINPDALTPQVTFTSIALFNMLRSPLAKFPIVVNQCIMAGVSVDRLEMFYGSGELEPTYPDVNGTRDIVITETSFSWEENRELRNDLNTLSDVAIRIPAGKLTMVVGAVGSGKSSLISAILGQMHNVGEGQVHLLGDVALVTQKAWIRNQTVRDNILFGKRYSPEFYDKVVHDSALLPDFAILTAGDRTEIGENGINVSGGQKQRIAIARAVYSDADTYFFDDPLSALDAHVGTHIFRHVVMDLVYQGKTMVVATHQIQYLQNADVVIVMKDRRVVYQGPWMPEQIDPEIVAYVGESDQHAVRGIGEDGDEAEKDENEGGDKRKKGDGKLVAAEAAESGHISWDVYMAYIKAGGVFIWVGLVFGFYILGSVLRAYQNWWLSVWTDNPDAHTLGYYLGGYTLIGVGTLVCTVMIAASYFIAGIRSSRILHHNMLDNLQKAPMTFWDTTPSGRILNRFSTDINRIDQRIPDIISNYLMSVVQVLSGVVVPGIVSPIFIAPGVGLCIVYYFLQRWFKMTSTELQRLDSLTMSPLYAHFSETLTGIETVRAFKVEAQLTDKMLHKIDANSKTFLFINIAQRWLNVYLNYLGSLLLFAICVISTAKAADLPAGQIALSISYSLTIMQSLAQYVTASSNLDIQMNCVERAKEYAEIPVEPRVDDSNRGLDNWPASGDIVLEGIKMRYRPELPLVLRGVSAHIRDGEKIGICGRTGSGKSSLILTLFRMIELEGGRIIIDGKDISDMCVTTLRSRMAIIPQDPTLFAASVRYNVDPTDIYADEDIWEALQMAQLAHVIQELDGGLDAMVHEGGANFSMGERQLFCLARAFLKRARILFLDEATASLDFTSDAALQNAIRTSFVDCTVLTIAHRINTIADSDRVMVLDDGNLIEFDSPANLMQRDTIYRSLVEASGGGDNN